MAVLQGAFVLAFFFLHNSNLSLTLSESLEFQENTTTWLARFGDVNSALFQHCLKASCDGCCSSEMAKDVEVSSLISS